MIDFHKILHGYSKKERGSVVAEKIEDLKKQVLEADYAKRKKDYDKNATKELLIQIEQEAKDICHVLYALSELLRTRSDLPVSARELLELDLDRWGIEAEELSRISRVRIDRV